MSSNDKKELEQLRLKQQIDAHLTEALAKERAQWASKIAFYRNVLKWLVPVIAGILAFFGVTTYSAFKGFIENQVTSRTDAFLATNTYAVLSNQITLTLVDALLSLESFENERVRTSLAAQRNSRFKPPIPPPVAAWESSLKEADVTLIWTLALAEHADERLFRKAIHAFLGNINEPLSRFPRATEQILEFITCKKPWARARPIDRAQLIDLFSYSYSSQFTDVIRSIFADENESDIVRLACIRFAERVGDYKCAPELNEVARSPESEMKFAALRALVKVDPQSKELERWKHQLNSAFPVASDVVGALTLAHVAASPVGDRYDGARHAFSKELIGFLAEHDLRLRVPSVGTIGYVVIGAFTNVSVPGDFLLETSRFRSVLNDTLSELMWKADVSSIKKHLRAFDITASEGTEATFVSAILTPGDLIILDNGSDCLVADEAVLSMQVAIWVSGSDLWIRYWDMTKKAAAEHTIEGLGLVSKPVVMLKTVIDEEPIRDPESALLREDHVRGRPE